MRDIYSIQSIMLSRMYLFEQSTPLDVEYTQIYGYYG